MSLTTLLLILVGPALTLSLSRSLARPLTPSRTFQMTWVSGLSHIVNEPTSGKCYSSKEAAEDIVTFYMEFLKDYPEHKGRLRHVVKASSAFQEQPPPPPTSGLVYVHSQLHDGLHCGDPPPPEQIWSCMG